MLKDRIAIKNVKKTPEILSWCQKVCPPNFFPIRYFNLVRRKMTLKWPWKSLCYYHCRTVVLALLLFEKMSVILGQWFQASWLFIIILPTCDYLWTERLWSNNALWKTLGLVWTKNVARNEVVIPKKQGCVEYLSYWSGGAYLLWS